MTVINPYSQPELEDKGWEFSSDDVTVKPDDGSVSEASLNDDLKERIGKIWDFKAMPLPWGQTVQAADIVDSTGLTIADWATVSAGTIFDTQTGRSLVTRAEFDPNTMSKFLYLGMLAEPQSDGSAEVIQRSIRLHFDPTDSSSLLAITFYADEVEIGGGEEPTTLALSRDLPVNKVVAARTLSSLNLGITETQVEALKIGDRLTYGSNVYTVLATHNDKSEGNLSPNRIVITLGVCNTGTGASYGFVGIGQIAYFSGADGAQMFTIQYDTVPAGLSIQWEDASSRHNIPCVFLTGVPEDTSTMAPYNRIWLEVTTAGAPSTIPRIALRLMRAESTDVVDAFVYTFSKRIGTPCLQDASVTEPKIADGAVVDTKIGAGSVSVEKLAPALPKGKVFSAQTDLSIGTSYTTSDALLAATGMTFADWETFLTSDVWTYTLSIAASAPLLRRYVTGAVYLQNGDTSKVVVELGHSVIAVIGWDTIENEVTSVVFNNV